MPRRKKVEEPVIEEEKEEAIEETPKEVEARATEEQVLYQEKVDFGEPFKPPTVETKPTDIVKVQVLVGTLEWEEGKYSKGDIFETTRERAERFSPTSVKIL